MESSFKTVSHSPSYTDRLRNASGELTIGVTKLGALGTFVYGGLCKFGTGVIPFESVTLGDAATMFHEGTIVASTFGYAAGNAILNNVAIPLYNSVDIKNYAMPIITSVGSVATSNILTTAAVVTTTAILYSVNSDLEKMDEIILDSSGKNKNGIANKVACGVSALAKGVLGVAIVLGTLHYNF